MGLMGGAPLTTGQDSERLFAAGVTCICCGVWPLAYDCFERSAHEDASTRYNQALCCFMVGWYEECLQLLGSAERLLDVMSGETFRMKYRPALPRPFPEVFRRWETTSEVSCCPLLPETTRDDALVLILRLRAETVFRLGRYEELRTIATRLGHQYELIENLLKQIDP